MAISGKQRIGTLLLHAGKIDEDQLQKGLQIQKEKDGYLGQAFVELGFLNNKELNKYISHQLKIPFLQLGYYNVDKSLMELFSERLIRKQKMLPLFRLNNTLTIALSDPLDSGPINAARDATGLKVDPVIAMENEIENAIDLHYGISGFVDIDSANSESTEISDLFDEAHIVELVDSIITQSQKYGCSDIHIEPRENDIRVRFRIDGRLQDFQSLPSDIHTALVSRLKIMANMDIAETRRPQDGRILFNSSKGRLDLRISTYPTLYGEKAVLRLLDQLKRRFMQRYPQRPRVPVHCLKCGSPQTTPRRIDNALQRQVVIGLGNHAQIGNCIANFGPFVEARTAHYTVWHAKRDQAFLELAHLKTGPNQNCNFVRRLAVPLQVFNLVAD